MVSARLIRRFLAALVAVMLISFQTAVAARSCVLLDDGAGGDVSQSQVVDPGKAAGAPSGHELCPAQNPLGSAAQPALSQAVAFNASAVPAAVWNYPPFLSAIAPGTARAWTASTEPQPLAIVHCCYRK